MQLTVILLLALIPAISLLYYQCFSAPILNVLTKASTLLLFILCLCLPIYTDSGSSWQLSTSVLPNLVLLIKLTFDPLTWVMLCLVSFISMNTHFYSARYLSSDQNQIRFMGQLSFLTFSIMLLLVSGNLLTAFVAWQLIGLSLYLLLNHYHYDVKANQAAKKKFMINRIGDISFLLALIIAQIQYGSTDFNILFSQSATISALIPILLFIAVMTKSAQFPFHIWLSDTMEAPTPVSAFIHASVVNAGGFLLIRLSPIYSQHNSIMLFIFLIGLTTTLLGSFFMQNQADTKKKLAYSTMGQMGYTIMQCGLGCFSSAVFHLISHGFLKATLLLSSGSTLNYTNQSPAELTENRVSRVLTRAISILLTFTLTMTGVLLVSHYEQGTELNPLLWVFISVSLYQLILKTCSQKATLLVKVILIILISILYFTYLVAIHYFDILVGHSAWDRQVPFMSPTIVAVSVIAILIAVYSWYKSTHPYKVKLLKKLYLFSFYKGNIERIYRHYLINPMRHLGDQLLHFYLKKSNGKKTAILATLLVWFVMMFAYDKIFVHQISTVSSIIILVNLALFIVILLLANRMTTLMQLAASLYLITLTIYALTNSLHQHNIKVIGWYQLINNLMLAIVFTLLLVKRQGEKLTDTLHKNRLPWPHLYMSLLLMLLIGIPGTASFVTEFYILEALIHINLLYAIVFGVGMVLLTLVVLHILQVHFFNHKTITEHTVPVPIWLHGVCLLTIGMHIFNGIHPSFMLQTLTKIAGV